MSFALPPIASAYNFRSFSSRWWEYSPFIVDENVCDKQVKNFRIQRRMLIDEVPKIIDAVGYLSTIAARSN